MRKTLTGPDLVNRPSYPEQNWLDLEAIATVEITSEDPNFPIEAALIPQEGPGWRAAAPGKQVIRIIFDNPKRLYHVRLEFSESEIVRTQEFALSWSSRRDGPLTEIVRQQWNFSPQGSRSEVEDYQLALDSVSVLQLALKPDVAPSNALASLAAWRIA